MNGSPRLGDSGKYLYELRKKELGTGLEAVAGADWQADLRHSSGTDHRLGTSSRSVLDNR